MSAEDWVLKKRGWSCLYYTNVHFDTSELENKSEAELRTLIEKRVQSSLVSMREAILEDVKSLKARTE